MNVKPRKKRLKEIEKVYKSLRINPEILQRHNFLVDLCRQAMPKRPVTPTETGTNSNGSKGLEGASLRS